MAAIIHKKDYAPFTDGLNTRFLPPSLKATECAVLTNAQVNNIGAIEKYPGFIKDGSPFPNSSDSFIRTIFDFRRGTATDLLLIAASDAGNANSTYKVDIKQTPGDGTYAYIGHSIGTAAFTHSNTAVTGTNTSWTHELKPGDKIKLASDPDADYTEIATVNNDTSLTLVAGGYLGTTGGAASYLARKIWNNNNVPRMCAFNNLAIITNGVDVPQAYDGTSVNALINSYVGTTITVQSNTAPTGSYIVSHKSRVFMAKNSTLYWSHVNDQRIWDPASLAPIFPQDGGDIISIISFGDSLFIFKNNGKIYRVFGNFDDSDIGTPAFIIKVDYNENIGIIADRSTVVHNNMLYFLAETGLYSIDMRGIVQRISYYIEPSTKLFNFSVGAQTSKSFPFTTKTQWDSGTHQGTYATQDGIIHSYFDDYRQTDALQNTYLCAIAIDSNNTIHVAYVPSSNSKQINYIKYYTPGFVPTAGSNPQKETNILTTADATILSLSIGVDPVTGKVGVAYTTNGDVYFVERSADSGVILGTWGNRTVLNTSSTFYGISLQYSGGGVPCVAYTGFNINYNFMVYQQRNSGTWTAGTTVDLIAVSGTASIYDRVSLVLDGSANIYISYWLGQSQVIRTQTSTNGGTTFSPIESPFTTAHTVSQDSVAQSFLDHLNNFYTAYSDTTGTILYRNHTAGTNHTVDNTANSNLRGALCLNRTVGVTTTDYFYYINLVGTSPNQQEKYIFETSNSLTNPTANVVSTGSSGSRRPSMQPFVHNGQTVASVQFGTNANEIVIRRIGFYDTWTGPEQHDSTLTAWGTYVVSGLSANGNTVQQQIALASSSPASNFVNINSGSIISSNPALIYNVPHFIVTLAAWAGIQITSIVLNYTGAGIDAKQPYGVSFYNEAYFAISEPGQTSNQQVLIQDIKNAYIFATYAVNCMERYKTNLYAGSSINGDLYVLKQGFTFNGSTYTMDVQSLEDFLGTIELKKDFYKMYIAYKVQPAGSFIFSYRFDQFASSLDLPWTSITIDQTATHVGQVDAGFAEIPLGGITARSIQFRLQNSNLGEAVSILGFSLHYGLTNRR